MHQSASKQQWDAMLCWQLYHWCYIENFFCCSSYYPLIEKSGQALCSAPQYSIGRKHCWDKLIVNIRNPFKSNLKPSKQWMNRGCKQFYTSIATYHHIAWLILWTVMLQQKAKLRLHTEILCRDIRLTICWDESLAFPFFNLAFTTSNIYFAKQ